jgi:hypothetical protein
MKKESKVYQSHKSQNFDCGNRPEPDFVPTPDEVEQSRKLVEEIRRSTRRTEPQQPRDSRAARALA